MLHLLADAYTTYNYQTSTTSGTTNVGALIAVGIGALILGAIAVVGLWKVFTKAGRPGWQAIVPFYNMWVLAEIAGKPGWWGFYWVLGFIPFVGWIPALIIGIILAIAVAKNFGKSTVFGVVGLYFFSFIGYLILGFGSAKYQPLSAGTDAATPTAGFNPVPPVDGNSQPPVSTGNDVPNNQSQPPTTPVL